VTVYPSSAEIIRTSKVSVPAGEHALVLHLPQATQAASIRVEGKATGRLDIGSVDSRVIKVPKTDPRISESERKKFETEIERLADQKAVVHASIQAGEAQKKLILNLAELPLRPAPAQGVAPQPDWASVEAMIGTRLTAVQQGILEAQIKSREIERKIADLQRQMNAIAPASELVTEVRVNVAAANAVEADLKILYNVPNASWSPVYDVRLATGGKGAPAKAQLIRRALVQQRTGESWDDVALTLSTIRPTAGTAAPDLTMLSVDYTPPPAPPRPMAEAMDGMVRQVAPARAKLRADAPAPDAAAPEPQPVEIAMVQTQIDNQAYQTAFIVPGRTTVLPSGEVKRVLIGQEDVDTSLVVRTVPRLDPTAYLYARLAVAKTAAPLLAGQVVLFRDEVFVGNGKLPQLAPGQDHELGFGADDRVKVKRMVLEDKKGQRGILTSSRTEERNYQITVKNHRATSVPVHILDRMPVAMQQDIKVDLRISGPQPTKRDVNDVRGTLLWEMTLAPEEEKQVAFGYTVTSPADKPIHYREWSEQQIRADHQLKF
jgi:uncharacterized protein (TIGR02231 family)